jgi:hypothetical protein
MDQEGNVLNIPVGHQRGSIPYFYCSTFWCTRNESESIFVYEEGTDFSYHSACDETYNDQGFLTTPGIDALCGIDQDCLIDGIFINIEAAQAVLEAKAAILWASSSAKFQIFPFVLVTNVYYDVTFTVDVSSYPAELVSTIEAFSI